MKKLIPKFPKKTAAALYLRACGSFAYQTLTLRSFYRTTSSALGKVSPSLAVDAKGEAEKWLATPEGGAALKAIKNWPPGAFQELVEALQTFSVRHSKHSLNAACVVFAHSQLDLLLSLCCEVASLADPGPWLTNLEKQKRKVDLADIGRKSTEQLRIEAVANEVSQLARESMRRRLEILETNCRPKSKSKLVADISVSRDQVESLDKLRQKIVHGLHLKVTDAEAEHAVVFVFRAGLFLLGLVGDATGMKRHVMRLGSNWHAIQRPVLRVFCFVRRECPEVADKFESIFQRMRAHQKGRVSSS